MALTQHQKAIIIYLQTGHKEKKQIVNKFKSWHYANSNKHIGDILSRMVNRGLIVRVKKGIYGISKEPVSSVSEMIDPKQQSLF